MKQKLLTLFTLLLLVCSGAWADQTWDFTSMSSSDEAGYNAATTNWEWNSDNGYFQNKFTTSSKTEYTSVISTTITQINGWKFARNNSKGLNAGAIRIYKQKNNAVGYFGYNNSGVFVKFSANAGDIITITCGNGESSQAKDFTFTNATISGGSGSTVSVPAGSTNTVATLTVTATGDVTFTNGSAKLKVYSITVATASLDPSISADNVNIAASATGGSIAYTVNNPVDGGVVTAAEKGTFDWLAVGTETTSPISFTAEENTGAERSATVTLTYTYNTSETVEKDVTITQAAKTYTITYNHGDSGTGDIAAGQKKHGVDFTLSSETFTRAGYEQTGWATTDGGSKAYELGGSYTENANITLYPVWEEAKYTVRYNVNGGGSCATESATQPTVGAALTLPTPTWDGYTFDGWYNDGSKIGDAGAEYTPTANITLYAKWTDNIEGKLFSYVDGNYGDKFQAFDGSGWVDTSSTGTVSGKDKTFTHATTGAQFIIENGAWDKKTKAISALAKLLKGTSSMSIIIPTGYQATVKILYGAYGTGDDYKMTVNGTAQASPNAKFVDDHTNAEIASDMKDITLNNQTGTLTLSVNGSKNIYIGRVAVTLTHVSATISDAGYATFSSKEKLDFTDVEGLTAYKATTTGENSVTLEDVTGIVPANEGLLLKGAANTYYIPVSTADPTADVDGNLLQSTATAAHNIAAGEVGRAFVFGKLGEEVGFFKAAEGKTIGAGKSYLLLDAAPAKDVEFLSFVFGDEESETTGIKAVVNEQAREGIYDLQGRKVTNPTKGLYIVNGKKVIIK